MSFTGALSKEETMEEIVVTRLWMAGVVAAMAIFGIIALVGVLKQKNHSEDGQE